MSRRSAGGPIGLLSALALMFGLVACDPLTGDEPRLAAEPDPMPDPDMLTVEGVLTDQGVECPVMRADDGTLYALPGGIGDVEAGTRLRVVGRRVEMSICMQGTPLEVISLEPQ